MSLPTNKLPSYVMQNLAKKLEWCPLVFE